jgi:hypothetical protein
MNLGAIKKKAMSSVDRTLLAAQSTAYDFANTDEKYFTTRTWYGHAGMFAAGGAAGVADARFFTGPDPGISKFGSIGIGVGVYATEWTITSRIKHGSYARYNGYAPRGFYSGCQFLLRKVLTFPLLDGRL